MENRNKWKGKGFYIALGVCVFAAVASSGLAINRMIGGLQTQQNSSSNTPIESGVQDPWDQDTEVGKNEENLPVEQTPSSSSQSVDSSSTSSAAAQQTQQESTAGQAVQEPSFSLPVAGRIVAPYSGDELIYNQTLADWRTHNGIDIAADAGAAVTAAMAGEVTYVGEDGSWGQVVEITSGELVLRYCGLAEKPAVEVGDQITQGQQIGALGEVPAEVADAPHLHLEASRAGVQFDPAELIAEE